LAPSFCPQLSAPHPLPPPARRYRRRMHTDRIDSISSYCDRCCERCAFTDRCAVYACQVAIAMCGDPAAGFELALGDPQPVSGTTPVSPWAAALDAIQLSPKEERDFARSERRRRKRPKELPLSRLVYEFTLAALVWLRDRREALAASADPILKEAIEVAAHDAMLIGATLHRAVDGRDRWRTDDEDIGVPAVQSDWNGSAKVALLSIERSHLAWQTIAGATHDRDASTFAERLEALRRLVRDEFPRAMEFVRPGFDEPQQAKQ
jgi:hypothetical protein